MKKCATNIQNKILLMGAVSFSFSYIIFLIYELIMQSKSLDIFEFFYICFWLCMLIGAIRALKKNLVRFYMMMKGLSS